MTRSEFELAKVMLAVVRQELALPSLSAQSRAELEHRATMLTAALFHPWIPFGWGRRFFMALWIVVGISGTIQGEPLFLLFWILAGVSSPRLVGMFAYGWGRLNSNFSDGFHGQPRK